MAGGAGTWRGTGGMATKLNAAQLCLEAGVDMVIANGARMEALYDIVEGKNVGTRFSARRGLRHKQGLCSMLLKRLNLAESLQPWQRSESYRNIRWSLPVLPE